MNRSYAAVLGLMVLVPMETQSAGAAIHGRVVSGHGQPIEHVRVEVEATGAVGHTDSAGSFDLEAEAPCDLTFSHPRFIEQTVAFAAQDGELVEFRLEPKQEIFESVAVSALRGAERFAPVSVSSSVVGPAEIAGLATTTGDLVAEVPSVSQNGQGGLFQTYSVRGVSRLRVLTLVEGMRITSERRAGVSASFLDPLLLDSVEVVRGPSSTFWGSGALGGVVQLFPKRFSELSVVTGFSTQGNEAFATAGYGGDDWSVALAARRASEAETPRGEALHSAFEQSSASVARQWQRGPRTYELLILGSVGRDIGKANTDFPDRTTTYPSENHALARFGVSSNAGWQADVWAHPNDLETRVETLGEGVSVVENEALDWGVDAQRSDELGEWSVRWGADLFARSGVSARETARALDGDLLLDQETLSNASEEELGLYGAFERDLGAVELVGGGRLAFQQQDNRGNQPTDDSAVTAFLGVVAPFGKGYELTANLGSGLRFPSLSERYFSGTTGRGFVEGNPELDPESSINADLGLRWFGSTFYLASAVFRNEIDDYIERIEVTPDRLTFVNLESGRIQGFELDGAWQVSATASFGFGGHLMDGESDTGEALADIPTNRYYLTWTEKRDRWHWRGRWEQRSSKSDLGSGEKAISSASLLSASVAHDLSEVLVVKLSGSNLLDEEYFSSADRQVPLSEGRSFSFSLSWHRQ